MSVKTAAPVIKHTPEEAWQAGPRVHIFTIEHAELNADGTVKTVLAEAWEAGEGETEADRPVIPVMRRVEYTMPAKPHAGLALKFLKSAREQGTEVALGWLFELAIGSEAYLALSDEPDLDMDMLSTLMLDVQARALGGLDAPKGS